VWEDLRELLLRLWQRSRQSAEEQRVDRERSRFWAEVREGEREAEARSCQSTQDSRRCALELSTREGSEGELHS